jgi:hypothetical protein
MTVTNSEKAPWLLLVFSLPTKRASQRVEIWRKLRRYGTLALRSSGHILPNTPINQERMEWLATAIRDYKGQASVIQVQGFDDLPEMKLKKLFLDARSRDYEKLATELKKLSASSHSQVPAGPLNRLRRQFEEVGNIDFFKSPLRSHVERLLARVEQPKKVASTRSRKRAAFVNRLWITRPRPGIDRVSSAWLIRRFIDAKARFVFSADPSSHPEAVPFDMFVSEGFGHRGEDCTFETLCHEFAIRDRRVKQIAHIIHDADLGDEKFGRTEGLVLDQVLNGWASQNVEDDELMQRGMKLIEGLYNGLS